MPADPSDLYAGYATASRIAPIDRAALETAFRPYGLLVTQLKGKSDADLRRMAARLVLANWRSRRAASGFQLPAGVRSISGIKGF